MPSSRRPTPASRAASTSTTTGPSAAPTMRSASASSRATSGWPSSRSIRSRPTTSAPSRTSFGRTCPARCFPTTSRHPEPADWFTPDESEVVRLSSKSHSGRPCAGREHSDPRARLPPHPADVGMRPRTATGGAGPRRVPVLGELHHAFREWLRGDNLGRQGGIDRGDPFVILGDQNAVPRWTATPSATPFSSCWTTRGSRIRSRRRPVPSRRPPCRAEPTSRTRAILRTTRRTSPTVRPATCAQTTCCPRGRDCR